MCSGTSYSGDLRTCCSADEHNGRCGGSGQVHYHCLERDSAIPDLDSRWYCTPCAKVRHGLGYSCSSSSALYSHTFLVALELRLVAVGAAARRPQPGALFRSD
jgi:hypothetical protein